MPVEAVPALFEAEYADKGFVCMVLRRPSEVETGCYDLLIKEKSARGTTPRRFLLLGAIDDEESYYHAPEAVDSLEEPKGAGWIAEEEFEPLIVAESPASRIHGILMEVSFPFFRGRLKLRTPINAASGVAGIFSVATGVVVDVAAECGCFITESGERAYHVREIKGVYDSMPPVPSHCFAVFSDDESYPCWPGKVLGAVIGSASQADAILSYRVLLVRLPRVGVVLIMRWVDGEGGGHFEMVYPEDIASVTSFFVEDTTLCGSESCVRYEVRLPDHGSDIRDVAEVQLSTEVAAFLRGK